MRSCTINRRPGYRHPEPSDEKVPILRLLLVADSQGCPGWIALGPGDQVDLLRVGDLILAADGEPVTAFRELEKAAQSGQTVLTGTGFGDELGLAHIFG